MVYVVPRIFIAVSATSVYTARFQSVKHMRQTTTAFQTANESGIYTKTNRHAETRSGSWSQWVFLSLGRPSRRLPGTTLLSVSIIVIRVSDDSMDGAVIDWAADHRWWWRLPVAWGVRVSLGSRSLVLLPFGSYNALTVSSAADPLQSVVDDPGPSEQTLKKKTASACVLYSVSVSHTQSIVRYRLLLAFSFLGSAASCSDIRAVLFKSSSLLSPITGFFESFGSIIILINWKLSVRYYSLLWFYLHVHTLSNSSTVTSRPSSRSTNGSVFAKSVSYSSITFRSPTSADCDWAYDGGRNSDD